MKPRLVNLIEKRFSDSATTYDAYAQVQKFACDSLSGLISSSDAVNANGPIMEIGCGTGLLSENLTKLFPNHHLSFLDISQSMITHTKSRLETIIKPESAKMTFHIADGEAFFSAAETMTQHQKYSTIVSSFTFQWFNKLEQTTTKIIEHLGSGGRLFFSMPSEGSFVEWEAMSTELNLPFTANPLPKVDLFFSIAKKLDCQLDVRELYFTERYANSLDFFISLKNIGANTSTRPPEDSLSTTQLRHLVKHWNKRTKNRITVTYRIIQGCFTKTK